jgi:hypothetical protein
MERMGCVTQKRPCVLGSGLQQYFFRALEERSNKGIDNAMASKYYLFTIMDSQ